MTSSTLRCRGVRLAGSVGGSGNALTAAATATAATPAVAAPGRRGAPVAGATDAVAALVACHVLAPSGTGRYCGARARAAGPPALAETVAPITDSSKHMFERHAVFSRFCRCPVVHIRQRHSNICSSRRTRAEREQRRRHARAGGVRRGWSSGVRAGCGPAAGPLGRPVGAAGGHGRRPAPGPRPVRPAGALVMVRPLEAPRPVRDAVAAAGCGACRGVRRRGWGDGARRAGRGVRSAPARPRRRGRARPARGRAPGCAGWSPASPSSRRRRRSSWRSACSPGSPSPLPRRSRPPAPVVVTAEPGETVWDVAARVAPGRPGAEVAAVAERIVADNALASVRLEPGQVLRVAGG